MNDLLRKNNGQPTNNIDVSCVQTVGLKHAMGLFVLLETNFFTFEAKCIILDNVCPIVEKRYWKLFENEMRAWKRWIWMEVRVIRN
jgi:hypothetical protein